MFLRAGRRMAWEYTPGSGSCFCCSKEAKDNQWGLIFLTFPSSAQTTTTSQSPSHWHSDGNSGNSFFQLLPVQAMPPVLGEDKDGGHQEDKGKHQGQEFLMHQLRYTKTVLCNLIFFSPPEVPRPASCIFAKLKAMEAEQTTTRLQNRTSSQKNERQSVLHHLRYMPLL